MVPFEVLIFGVQFSLLSVGGPENCIVPLNEEFALRWHLSTDPEFHEMALLKTFPRGKDQWSPSNAIG
jgi:hypothetical protein